MDTKFETTFAKIGGINALHDIVDIFYDRVLSDAHINSFFEGADMNIQRGKMKAFLMMALGGPVKFTGKDIRKAHTHLVAGGLSDKHYDIVAHHLDAALHEYGIDEPTRLEVGRVVEDCRKDVLNN